MLHRVVINNNNKNEVNIMQEEKTNNKTRELAPATEIMLGILAGGLNFKENAAILENPKDFLLAKADLDVSSEISVNTVTNKDGTVHLVLPYYEALDFRSSCALDDEDLTAVSGGEILGELEKRGINTFSKGAFQEAHKGGDIGAALASKTREHLLKSQGLMLPSNDD